MISGSEVKPDQANGLEFQTMVLCTTNSHAATDVHEIANVVGLLDNDPVASQNNCLLDDNCADIMAGGPSCDAGYFNIYHRYLLDWIETEVLPYTDH